MKKILFTILLITSPAFAFENVFIISQEPVKSITVQNPLILDAKAISTIDNEKRFIILIPKTTGKTKIHLDIKNGINTFDVKVTEDKTITSNLNKLYSYSIDNPPEFYDIPKPPALKGGE